MKSIFHKAYWTFNMCQQRLIYQEGNTALASGSLFAKIPSNILYLVLN